jgi:hypothetical protein
MNDMQETEFDIELMEAAAGLPKEITPQRDLWPGIEQAIAQPPVTERSRWAPMLAQAAAVVLLVGGSSGLTYLAVSDDGPRSTPMIPVEPLEFEPVSGSFGSHYNLGPDFQNAHNDLSAQLDEELATLSLDTRSEVEANLNAIRAAILEINQALDKEPDNPFLQRLLLSTYREELSIMKKVDGMASSVMRRNDI